MTGAKTADVGALVTEGRALHRVVAEVALCEVVCPNCHRRRTARRAGWLRASPAWRLALGAQSSAKARNQLHALDHLAERGCVDCGERDLAVLDFDHIGPKRGSVMKLAASGVSLKTLADEIANCEVRCASCHRRVTAIRANHFRARPQEITVVPDDDPQLRRERARRLRREGRLIEDIASAIGAAETTVGRWVADIPLTDRQRKAELDRRRRHRIVGDESPDASVPRTCSRCGLEQPAAAFSWNNGRRRTECKACVSARNAARTDEQRAEAAAKQRERRRRAREAGEAARRTTGP